MTFLQPAFLWGLAFMAVPVVLHLIFRRVARRIPWAAIRHLRLAVQHDTRSWRVKQFLLLLLRVLAIACFFLFLARPVFQSQLLSGWIPGGSRHYWIVLDDSLSMQAQTGGTTTWQRAAESTQAILRQLSADDRVTCCAASEVDAPWIESRSVREVLQEGLQLPADAVTDKTLSWKAVFDRLSTSWEGSSGPHNLVIITDLRKVGWQDTSAAVFQSLPSESQVYVLDVGSVVQNNLTITQLLPLEPHVLTDIPSRFAADIRSLAQVESTRVTFRLGDQAQQITLSDLGPRQKHTVRMRLTCQSTGPQSVRVSVADQGLQADNERWFVTDAKPNLTAWLVEQGTRDYPSGLDFARLALSLGREAADAFELRTLRYEQWHQLAQQHAAGQAIAERLPDLILWSNVAHTTGEDDRFITHLVADGTGLIFFPGPLTDTDRYNQQWRAEGSGLMPLVLGEIRTVELQGILLGDHVERSCLSYLSELKPTALQPIFAQRILDISIPARKDAPNVIARWNGPGRNPALIQSRFGKGSVLWWTVSADTVFSNWPIEPSFVLAIREAATALARNVTHSRTVLSGHTIWCPTFEDTVPVGPTVLLPNGTTREAVPVLRSPADTVPTYWLRYAATGRRGIYRFRWQNQRGEPKSDTFAVNPDVRESDLTRLSPEACERMFAGQRVTLLSTEEFTEARDSNFDLWRVLAWSVLIMLCMESVWATVVGQGR